MVKRVWQSVSRTRVGRAVVNRPRVATVLLLLVLLVAAQGVGAADPSVSTPLDGVSTQDAQIETGP